MKDEDVDPLQRGPDPDHPIAWYYGGLHMGFLTRAAYESRLRHYASNSARGWGGAGEHSTYLERGKPAAPAR
jgi:hypothetical protein